MAALFLRLRANPLKLSPKLHTSLIRNAATSSSETASSSEPLTHYRITLRRSAISLPSHIKGTLVSLGIHRRLQTVYHEHSPINAGKILRVKELVEVENVPASAVKNKTEQRRERKAVRGYKVVGSSLLSATP
ncbi:hypothetical protein PHLCEN_2v1907 [Hermanssonia centrifuga]|uniref:Large ribosomal subunit protein uL30m n=1 Tax=Hermanssonia centrifuga TaxID=98765 RepID=A0A2R6RVF8_9APHY|nr:hypothetical protein PHLCEN_2v1907 [Hermanssonia centrifuga]